jgi:hypothetical protein
MNETTNYSQVLRAIGQDLEERSLNVFELEIKGSDNFVSVREIQSERNTGSRSSKEFRLSGFLRTLRKQEPKRSSDETAGSLESETELRYTQDEIDRLEQKGQSRRGSASGSPELLSLSQILRAVGTYIDQKGGRLVAVARRDRSNEMPSITLRYESYNGELKEEDHLFSDIYDLNVHLYKKRKKVEVQIL